MGTWRSSNGKFNRETRIARTAESSGAVGADNRHSTANRYQQKSALQFKTHARPFLADTTAHSRAERSGKLLTREHRQLHRQGVHRAYLCVIAYCLRPSYPLSSVHTAMLATGLPDPGALPPPLWRDDARDRDAAAPAAPAHPTST